MPESRKFQISNLSVDKLHAIWRTISPDHVYYPDYQELNEQAIAVIDSLPIFKGTEVLDIGCNSGLFSYFCSNHANSVLGCDTIPEMISRANAVRLVASQFSDPSKVDFVCADFTTLLRKATFTGIIATRILYHIGDQSLKLLADYLTDSKPSILIQPRPNREIGFGLHPEWGKVSTTTRYGGMYKVEDNIAFLRDCGYDCVKVSHLHARSFGEYFPVITAESSNV